jgi:hypothetical protein
MAQQGPFFGRFRIFFDSSADAACKNVLRLAKNGHFFVSDMTTQPFAKKIMTRG